MIWIRENKRFSLKTPAKNSPGNRKPERCQQTGGEARECLQDPPLGCYSRHFSALVKVDRTTKRGKGHLLGNSTSALFPMGVRGVCLHVLPLVARPFSPDHRLTGIEAVGPSPARPLPGPQPAAAPTAFWSWVPAIQGAKTPLRTSRHFQDNIVKLKCSLWYREGGLLPRKRSSWPNSATMSLFYLEILLWPERRWWSWGMIQNAESITPTPTGAQLEDMWTCNFYLESGRANAIRQSANWTSREGKADTLSYRPGLMELTWARRIQEHSWVLAGGRTQRVGPGQKGTHIYPQTPLHALTVGPGEDGASLGHVRERKPSFPLGKAHSMARTLSAPLLHGSKL